jgi:hypothetical protein
MRTVAVIPVHSRLPLLKLTIERLIQKCGVTEVICLGSTKEEADICTGAGAAFAPHRNKPIGRKLNYGFMLARLYDPDAVMYLSSSDWISAGWLSQVALYISDYDLIGKLDTNFCHVGSTIRAVHWRGYSQGSSMEGQMIGIGRVLSRQALEEMKWQPFDSYLNSSLDYSMIFKLMKHASRCRQLIMLDDTMQSLSISTDLWSNIHSFHQHAAGAEERDLFWLLDNFPEIFTLKNRLHE